MNIYPVFNDIENIFQIKTQELNEKNYTKNSFKDSYKTYCIS